MAAALTPKKFHCEAGGIATVNLRDRFVAIDVYQWPHMSLDQVVSLRDWLNNAIPIIEARQAALLTAMGDVPALASLRKKYQKQLDKAKSEKTSA